MHACASVLLVVVFHYLWSCWHTSLTAVVFTFRCSWARERYTAETKLSMGMQSFGSMRGVSSHVHSPFAGEHTVPYVAQRLVLKRWLTVVPLKRMRWFSTRLHLCSACTAIFFL
jgi:hypothetical protein